MWKRCPEPSRDADSSQPDRQRLRGAARRLSSQQPAASNQQPAMAGETGGGSYLEGPSLQAPINSISWVGPGDPIYNENVPFLLLLDCCNSCIGGLGPFETPGDPLLRGPPRPSLWNHFSSPAASRQQDVSRSAAGEGDATTTLVQITYCCPRKAFFSGRRARFVTRFKTGSRFNGAFEPVRTWHIDSLSCFSASASVR